MKRKTTVKTRTQTRWIEKVDRLAKARRFLTRTEVLWLRRQGFRRRADRGERWWRIAFTFGHGNFLTADVRIRKSEEHLLDLEDAA